MASLRHLAKLAPDSTSRTNGRPQTSLAAAEIRDSSVAAPSAVARSRSPKLTVVLACCGVLALTVPARAAAARAGRMYLRMAVLLSSDLNRLSSDIRLVLLYYDALHNKGVQVQNSDGLPRVQSNAANSRTGAPAMGRPPLSVNRV